MKNLYFYVGHRDLIGGGQLALYHLAVALQELFEVHLSTDWHPGMWDYEYMVVPKRNFQIGRPEKIDLFLASSYTELPQPRDELNVFYTFFPRYAWDLHGYDSILTISRYSQDHVRSRWDRESEVIVGGVFFPDYICGAKEPIIMNSSRFFLEGDPENFRGHSKNQHLLIEAFKELQDAEDWQLILAGSVLTEEDSRYLNACRKLADGDARIRFYPMLGRDKLRDLYAKAKIFVHAMGFGRADEAEVEHYGFCVEKALISGCHTIVHQSGGAPELAHEMWVTPRNLWAVLQIAVERDFDHETAAQDNRWRTFGAFQERVTGVFGEWA